MSSDEGDGALADQSAGQAHVAVSRAREDAVEPVEESAQQAAGSSLRGRSSSADRAGLNVRALKAESSTEIAIVTANCWYSRR